VPVYPVGAYPPRGYALGPLDDPYPQWDARRRTTIVVAPTAPTTPSPASPLKADEPPSGDGDGGEDRKGRVHGGSDSDSAKTNKILMWTAIGLGIFLAIVFAVYAGVWLATRKSDGSGEKAGRSRKSDGGAESTQSWDSTTLRSSS
jgi:hypothetical protein